MAEQEHDDSMFDMGGDIANAPDVPLLPKGEYPVTIMGLVKKFKEETGNKYAQVTVVISPDDFPADYAVENNPDGIKLTWSGLSLNPTPRARAQVRDFHRAFGVRAEGTNLKADAFVGAQGRMRIDHDMWNNKLREKITGFVLNV